MNQTKVILGKATALLICLLPCALLSATPSTAGTKLPPVGTVRILSPREITSSPFSLGCETLDRALWNPAEVYPHLAELGVKWARLQTGWARCEPRQGVYDWAWLDHAVDGLLAIGIQPWLNVGYGNPLYTEGAARYHPLGSKTAYEAWQRFVSALANHFRDRVLYYEIWNEPNLEAFWKPDYPDPVGYTRLVTDAGQLIRARNPNALIVGGVTARIPLNYIQDALAAGLADSIDVFSFHPYSTYPETYTHQIKALRRLLDAHRPGIKLWQGENGFPSMANSTGFVGEGPWTENIQAKIMLRRLLLDCELGIELTNWFIVVDLHDYPVGSGNLNSKGILRAKPSIAPKVAFTSLQHLTSLVHGAVSPRNSLRFFDSKKLGAEDIFPLLGLHQPTWNRVQSVCLNSSAGPVLGYWLEDKASDLREADTVSLMFNDWEGEGFSDPVLIDPLHGIIYEMPQGTRHGGSNTWRDTHRVTVWNGLPIQDYPLLIMERAAVIFSPQAEQSTSPWPGGHLSAPPLGSESFPQR